jgi:hypothetical protein
MKKERIKCRNCEKEFNVEFDFCPHCGQKSNEDLTLSVLFYNTIHNYFSVDARFFRSFFPLLLKPGYLASKFIEGKRLMFLHPAQMYLFISVVFFFLFSFIERNQVESLDKSLSETLKKEKVIDTITPKHIRDSMLIQQKKKDSIERIELRETLKENKFITGMSDEKIDSLVKSKDFKNNGPVSFGFNEKSIDSLINIGASDEQIYKQMGLKEDTGWFGKRLYAQALKFYKSRQGGSILKTFYDAIPIAMFFLLPIFALILKLLYRKHGSYSYHLVFSFYYFAFLFTAFSIIIVLNFIVDIPNWIDFLAVISTFIYLCLALGKFYKQGKLKSFFKGSIASFLFLSFVAPTVAFILGMFAFLFY